ncbi:hypothetical protein JRQ81_017946 [Phrynocephalus forsythii]|uniref:Uncharacterized protein n=1 Tax=Phrynocephalus forsythii TaxID=171643 RepID=A0A9Q1B0N6_9SAUR|nr:hypothetical protein JRQ81_017946 [Phrynocephalus forsythii]
MATGDRSPGVFSLRSWCRRRFGLLLLATAAGLCSGVWGVKNPSCHEVRTAFQIRQIGPLKLVPDVPTTDSTLQICQQRAPTCCTKKMEESYQAAVRRERMESIQTLNFELKYMIVGHITAFQGRNTDKSAKEFFHASIRIYCLSQPIVCPTVFSRFLQEAYKETLTVCSMSVMLPDTYI